MGEPCSSDLPRHHCTRVLLRGHSLSSTPTSPDLEPLIISHTVGTPGMETGPCEQLIQEPGRRLHINSKNSPHAPSPREDPGKLGAGP